jgi:hypothetical protein
MLPAGGPPRAVFLSGVVALPLLVLDPFLGGLPRPHERRPDGGPQLAPLAVGPDATANFALT